MDIPIFDFLKKQLGLKTDPANPAGSLHAKIGNISNQATQIYNDISNQATQIYNKIATDGAVLFPSPSSNVKITATASDSQYSGSTSYAKKKEIRVYRTGFYRVSFNLWTTNGEYTVKGRIYRNGNAYGTERSTSSTSAVVFTEDLYFYEGDTVELWIACAANTSPYYYAYTNYLGLAFDLSFVHGIVTDP